MSTPLQTPQPPIRATWRFLIAYSATFRVIGSYAWLNFAARLLGETYREERIGALHRRNARLIERTVLRLQGLFIKVGQLFSIMTNFLPADLRVGLENLQDAIPARPYEQIETRIREELGGSPDEVFASFERTPIAAASLGQVHAATTKDGRKVAVKVQHLGVEIAARSDLRTIRRILRIVKRFVKVRGLDNYYREIRTMIFEELDFILEARHIEEIAANFPQDSKVRFPKVLKELSTSRVLTLEFAAGCKITDRAKIIEMGHDPAEVARRLVTAYCQMIFVDGIYHADPHPGNILVQPDGALMLLDFGAVGVLSKAMREGISAFFEAIIKADEEELLAALRRMGFLQVGTNQAAVATKVIEHFHRKVQENLSLDTVSLGSVKLDPKKGLESLADLRQMNVSLRELSEAFHMPREWVLLERTGLLLAGLCTHLDPEMKPAEIIRPYLEEFVFGKDRDWSEMLLDLMRDKLLAVLKLPGQIDKAIARTLDGQVSFRIQGIDPAARLLYAAGHQLVFTALSISSVGVCLYFFDHGAQRLAEIAAY
ncbi:MAG: AarF/UbiB family protein, partial [Myxococcota bacterium]|nr:AarF/UbiB family protein [Myxococcota bacterium]